MNQTSGAPLVRIVLNQDLVFSACLRLLNRLERVYGYDVGKRVQTLLLLRLLVKVASTLWGFSDLSFAHCRLFHFLLGFGLCLLL